MKIAVSQHFGPELLRLLGVEHERVRRAVITLEVDDLITVELEQFAAEPAGGEIELLQKKFSVKAVLTGTEPIDFPESGNNVINVTHLESEAITHALTSDVLEHAGKVHEFGKKVG